MSKTYIGAYNIVNPNIEYNQNDGTVNNPMTSDLDAGSNKIINLSNPADAGDSVNLGYLQSVLPNEADFVQNPLTGTLNANNNIISNVTALYMKDAVQDLTTYIVTTENGAIISTNASDDSSSLMHIAINEGGTTKPYFTDFRTFPITNLSTLEFSDGGTISKSSSSFQFNQPLDMNNNYIKDVQNIQFFNAPPLEIDLSNNLLYDDAIVVTANNIAGYISAGNWEPNASSDLNMTTHNINLTTGNINLDSGQLVLNESYAVGVDSANNLTYDKNIVLTCQANILGSVPMVDSTPSTAIGIDRLTPIVFAVNTISKVGIFDNPVFDIELTMTLQDNYTINLNSAELEIGLCNAQNPINSDNIGGLLTYTGGFKQLENGNLYVRFRTDESSENMNIINTWTQACNLVSASNFYVYVLASAVSITDPNTNIVNVQSSTINFNVIDPSDPLPNNELININENCKLQTYNVSTPVQLINGTVTIDIFDYSNNVSLIDNGSFYVKCTVVGTNLCIKFSTFIFDNTIVTSSGSQNIIYKDASFVSCGLFLNASVLSVQIVMNSNLVGLSMCKCKTKIVTPI